MAIARGRHGGRDIQKNLGPTTVRVIKRLGWRRDLPDQRDFTYAAPPKLAKQNLPGNIDLRQVWNEPCFQQGDLGSCTSNAIAGAIEFALFKEGSPSFTPSRLFIYYNERVIEGTVSTDNGAEIRDGIKSVAGVGYCGEDVGSPPPGCPADSIWPYDITEFADQPPQACYDCAGNHKIGSYLSISQNLADMQGCLGEGFPFIIGFTVYQSFLDMTAPWDVPMPQQGDIVKGGHAVLVMGYDNGEQLFICRNSWGPTWGDGGYFYMPSAYLLDNNLSSDFWTIRLAN
jgi:C1A family cysteine protease